MSLDPAVPPVADPLAKLERAFIEEHLAKSGHQLDQLAALPADEARALMRDAAQYASGRLTEVETRAHLVEDLHAAAPPVPGQPPPRPL